MTWEIAANASQVLMAICSLITVILAVAIARMVADRDDNRQLESEQRELSRRYVIELQNFWLRQNSHLNDVITAIQQHQTAARASKNHSEVNLETIRADTAIDHDRQWQETIRLSNEVNRTGDEMANRILDLRAASQEAELLESRIDSPKVRDASLRMRRASERVVYAAANRTTPDYRQVRSAEFFPAYHEFVRASFEALVGSATSEDEAARLRRISTSRIASSRTWEEADLVGPDDPFQPAADPPAWADSTEVEKH